MRKEDGRGKDVIIMKPEGGWDKEWVNDRRLKTATMMKRRETDE